MVGHLDDAYGSSKCPTGHLSLYRIAWFQYGRDFGPSVWSHPLVIAPPEPLHDSFALHWPLGYHEIGHRETP
jgi:hypothetical protein